MKTERIQIVDRGRGPQLSTSRITVQDLLPYLQQNSSPAEIQEAMPTLSLEEIQVIERYVQDHYEEVMEQDRKIRLEDRVEALKGRVYSKKLGSVFDKVERVEKTTFLLASFLQIHMRLAQAKDGRPGQAQARARGLTTTPERSGGSPCDSREPAGRARTPRRSEPRGRPARRG